MNAEVLYLLLGAAGAAGAIASRKLPASGKVALTLVGVAAAGLGLARVFC